MSGMIVEMTYGVPEMQVVMPGFGEPMLPPLERYVKYFSNLGDMFNRENMNL